MKYSVSNTINGSLDTIQERMSNPNGAKEWTEGLNSMEQVKGTFCEAGSQRKLHFTHGKREMEMMETILENNLPRRIKFAYDSPMGRNEVELIFEALSNGHVKQTCNTDIQMKGMMKYFGFLMKGMMKKQSLKYMDGFKEFVER